MKFWCRSCAAYGDSACPSVGHISEELRLVAGKWKPHQRARLVVAVPPISGRGSVDHVACDANGYALEGK